MADLARSFNRMIAERRRADEERSELEAQLHRSQRLETVGTLAGGIAHDFNNLLTPILGYVEMTIGDLPSESEARSRLAHVTEAATRAKDLVKQILTFSRDAEQVRRPIQLHPIVKETLKLLRATIPSTIEIRSDIDPECGFVLADSTQIHQVVMNLCTNACQAMRRAAACWTRAWRRCRWTQSLRALNLNLREGPYVRLEVTDTGHGMDRDTTERVFEPFFTTKTESEGTGLGLSVVHGIILSLGGEISVRSEPGVGTTFHVYLPVIEEEVAEEAAGGETVPGGSESILLVDDEREVVDLLTRMLERLGYRVVTATTDPTEALQAFRERPGEFDLVITDQTMPKMTGARLSRELLLIRPDVPIVLVTGYSETFSPADSKDLGIRDYVMKPVTLSKIAEVVRRTLDEERQGSAASADVGVGEGQRHRISAAGRPAR